MSSDCFGDLDELISFEGYVGLLSKCIEFGPLWLFSYAEMPVVKVVPAIVPLVFLERASCGKEARESGRDLRPRSGSHVVPGGPC